MIAHRLAKHLLEADIQDPDDDPESFLSAFDSKNPNYTTRQDIANHWIVYKNTERGEVHIGEIYFDDQKNMPPGAAAHWAKYHYLGSWGFRDDEREFFETFDQALDAVIKRRRSYNPNESLEKLPQPAEPVKNALHAGLIQFYDQVRIHARPADLILTENQQTWTVACRQDAPRPVQETLNAAQWKQQVSRCVSDWAAKNSLSLLGEAQFNGLIRQNVTLRFDTRPKHLAESADDPDDPEAFLDDFTRLADWQRHLHNMLWEFHGQGVGYDIAGTQHAGIIACQTYFPVEEGDFANRLFDFLVQAIPHFFDLTDLKMWTRKSAEHSWQISILYNRLANSSLYTEHHGDPVRTWKA